MSAIQSSAGNNSKLLPEVFLNELSFNKAIKRGEKRPRMKRAIVQKFANHFFPF